MYVDNSMDVPVGIETPLGIYDADSSQWIPRDSGRVIEILGVDSQGRAELDLEGDGNAATGDELQRRGISSAERSALADKYSSGDTLWWVNLPHLSTPDLNWPPSCDEDASSCERPDPETPDTQPPEDSCQQSGSTIECESTVETVAGGPSSPYRRKSPGKATDIPITASTSFSVGRGGTLYINDKKQVWRVEDGYATRYLVNPFNGALHVARDQVDAPYRLAPSPIPSNGHWVEVGPEGRLLMTTNKTVLRVDSVAPSVRDAAFAVPASGSDRVFTFSPRGRHRETIDADTGTTIREFQYTTDGWLEAIVDRDGRETTIRRDSAGRPEAIESPDGLVTDLATWSSPDQREGFLESITNPAGETWTFDYYNYSTDQCDEGPTGSNTTGGADENCEGLLKSLVPPRGQQNPSSYRHEFRYDDRGRLVEDTGPEGFQKTLDRTEVSMTEESIELTTAEDRKTTYRTDFGDEDASFSQKRRQSFPDGTTRSTETDTRGTQTTTRPDVTTVETKPADDPRFGGQSEHNGQTTTTTPSGLTRTVEQSTTV